MLVRIKRLHPQANLPVRMSESAGAWDVTATEIVEEANGFVICKLGFSLAPPPNYRVILVPRSNITKYGWVMANSIGIGDSDYRGEYQMRFRSIPQWGIRTIGEDKLDDGETVKTGKWDWITPEFPYKKGDRIGQMWVEKVEEISFVEVVDLDVTSRGVGGFGSTGL